jgi:tartrate dehydrogenase/decarboxylase/D-malate dehydrogenase
VHGAAFDITGKGIANPLATISAVALMMDHFKQPEAAQRVDGAVARCLNERKVLTPDLGGSASTSQVGNEIVRLLGGG